MDKEIIILRVPTRFELQRQIKNINSQIETLAKVLKDHKVFQSGEITRAEIQEDITNLRNERSTILNMITQKQYSK
jgi:hypothetical protein